MVNSLRQVDFSHPTGHYRYMDKISGPLEKILGAPLLIGQLIMIPSGTVTAVHCEREGD